MDVGVAGVHVLGESLDVEQVGFVRELQFFFQPDRVVFILVFGGQQSHHFVEQQVLGAQVVYSISIVMLQIFAKPFQSKGRGEGRADIHQ